LKWGYDKHQEYEQPRKSGQERIAPSFPQKTYAFIHVSAEHLNLRSQSAALQPRQLIFIMRQDLFQCSATSTKRCNERFGDRASPRPPPSSERPGDLARAGNSCGPVLPITPERRPAIGCRPFLLPRHDPTGRAALSNCQREPGASPAMPPMCTAATPARVATRAGN
jgi:hypothetical protein